MNTIKRKTWEIEEINQLSQYAREHKTCTEISQILKRPVSSVRVKLRSLKIEYTRTKIEALNLAPTEAAYIAGFIDGDGCIRTSIVYNDDKTQVKTVIPVIELSNSNQKVLSWIGDKINSSGKWKTTTVYKKIENRYASKPKPHYHLCVTGRGKVKSLLSEIIPYLKIKHIQATVLLEFIELRLQSHSQRYSISELKLVLKVKELNDSRKAPHLASRDRLKKLIDGIFLLPYII
ncbi:hypothetical protein LCGC14_2683940 [marine sediment metagenome]|uniref:Homing endonuclease LAGLIDADG domain-containing protein n=1 Tax=marine sediment metagenome TaxID=412755 RepID=A0A0F9CC83_9ZZZZ